MDYINHHHYHIIELSVEGETSIRDIIIFINKQTLLLEKVVAKRPYFTSLSSLMNTKESLVIRYNSDKYPIYVNHLEIKTSHEDAIPNHKKYCAYKLKWRGTDLIYYEDEKGNWYDSSVIDGSCPFNISLLMLDTLFENIRFCLSDERENVEPTISKEGRLITLEVNLATLRKIEEIVDKAHGNHDRMMESLTGEKRLQYHYFTI